jgi:hypothetical protein
MSKKTPSQPTGFTPVQSLFSQYQLDDKGGYITQEFQDFGYRLALDLDDMKHKSLYMRLAKTVPRILLERALSFVADAQNAKSKARLFMWKLKELRAAAEKS